jgi:hypothetical protein
MFFLLFLLDDRRIRNPDPYLRLMDPDADPGGPKTYRSCGSGTLEKRSKKSQNSRIEFKGFLTIFA